MVGTQIFFGSNVMVVLRFPNTLENWHWPLPHKKPGYKESVTQTLD